MSVNIYQFVERAISENNGFLEMDYDVKKAIIEIYVSEITMKKSGALVPIVGQDGGIETPVDIEAEAKARLKGSVGGVQGILGIQASVAAGITDLDSAIVLLQEIYGFDPKTSRKMLGTPKIKVAPTFNKFNGGKTA